MSWIKDQVSQSILRLRMSHKALSEHQMILIPEETKALSYAFVELKKAIIELKIAVLRAIIGESK